VIKRSASRVFRYRRALSLPLATILVAANACGGSAGDSSKQYVIGSSGALSGAVASFVKPVVDGAGLYFAQQNKAGGVNGRKIKFVALDDKFDTGTALSNVRQLANQGAIATIGPQGATQSTSAIPLVQQLKIPMLADGLTASQVVPPLPYVYGSDVPGNDVDAHAAAEFLTDPLNLPAGSRVAYVGFNTAAGVSGLAAFKKEFAALSGRNYQLALSDLLPLTISDVSAEAGRIKAAKPAAIILGTADSVSIQVMRALQSLGVNVPTINVHAGASPGTVTAVNSSEFYVLRQFEVPTANNPAMNAFNAAVASAGLTDEANAGYGFLAGYVTAAIVVEALKNCPGSCSSGAVFNEALLKTRLSMPGILFGPIQFSSQSNQGIATERAFHLVNGKIVEASSKTYTLYLASDDPRK
jgi:branched-chain amino acid transport system substrate-binding protein